MRGFSRQESLVIAAIARVERMTPEQRAWAWTRYVSDDLIGTPRALAMRQALRIVAHQTRITHDLAPVCASS